MRQKRYRHKLNMLEPGLLMCKIIGVSGMIALVLYLCKVYTLALVAISIEGVMLFILMVLLAMEQHQDHKLYLDAKKDDPDIK